MPTEVKKKGKCYQTITSTVNKKGKEVKNVHAKCTTLEKATKQKEILDNYNRKLAIFDKYGEKKTKEYKEQMKKKYGKKKRK